MEVGMHMTIFGRGTTLTVHQGGGNSGGGGRLEITIYVRRGWGSHPLPWALVPFNTSAAAQLECVQIFFKWPLWYLVQVRLPCIVLLVLGLGEELALVRNHNQPQQFTPLHICPHIWSLFGSTFWTWSRNFIIFWKYCVFHKFKKFMKRKHVFTQLQISHSSYHSTYTWRPTTLRQ